MRTCSGPSHKSVRFYLYKKCAQVSSTVVFWSHREDAGRVFCLFAKEVHLFKNFLTASRCCFRLNFPLFLNLCTSLARSLSLSLSLSFFLVFVALPNMEPSLVNKMANICILGHIFSNARSVQFRCKSPPIIISIAKLFSDCK
jgi:hypothetical protein